MNRKAGQDEDVGAQPPVAIVTGAGSGIGQSVARALASNGYQVILAGRTASKLNTTLELLESPAGMPDHSHCAFVTDVSQISSVENLFAEVERRYARCDLLFNNAGVNLPPTSTEELAIEDWQRVLDINTTGVFLCAQAALRLMLKQQPSGGRIINNGSISAQVPRPQSLAYTAAKHAVSGITKSISLDYRDRRICCGQIDIGNAHTDMVLGPDGKPAEPTIRPEDVADAVVHMAQLPLSTNVPFITLMSNEMRFMGRG